MTKVTKGPKVNIHHLSASSISAFRECPMAFYGRYHLHWPWVSPPMQAQAMALGSAVHKALEAHHTGRDAIAAFCQLTPSLPNAVFVKAIGLIRSYTADESPNQRDRCEEKFSINIPGVEPVIIGYIDVIRGLTVRELKTTSSPTWWTAVRARESLQTGLYSYAVSQQNHGAQVTVEHHIMKALNGQYSHEVLTSHPTKADHRDMLGGIRQTWRDIQSGELRANCHPGKCRYPTKCVEYGYVGTDSRELELPLHGWQLPSAVKIG